MHRGIALFSRVSEHENWDISTAFCVFLFSLTHSHGDGMQIKILGDDRWQAICRCAARRLAHSLNEAFPRCVYATGEETS